MKLEKVVKKEMIITIVSVLVILSVFLGVSYASFMNTNTGQTDTVQYGNIGLSYCADSDCDATIENIGQVIGTEKVGGVTYAKTLYPVADADALIETPYIFKLTNTGTLKERITIFLEEDESFVPAGEQAQYINTLDEHADQISVGFSGTNLDLIKTKYANLSNNKLVQDIILEPGESKVFRLWTWVSNDSENTIQGTYFVANIRVVGEFVPKTTWYTDCSTTSPELHCKIITHNAAIADSGLNFTTTTGSGVYYTANGTATEDLNADGIGERVYYYRGNVTNNYVLLNNMCWQIVRANEDGSVRLMYYGTPSGGQCSTASAPLAGKYNENKNSNTFVGYKFNENSLTYPKEHTNATDSMIKTALDAWYWNNMRTVENKLEDAIFCNDREVQTGSGIGTVATVYKANARITAGNPQFKCGLDNDKFARSANKGNGGLTSLIGLISADELAYLGNPVGVTNTSSFVSRTSPYWTITPYGYETNAKVMAFNAGNVVKTDTDSSLDINPVINIKSTLKVTGGDGNKTTPYVIE